MQFLVINNPHLLYLSCCLRGYQQKYQTTRLPQILSIISRYSHFISYVVYNMCYMWGVDSRLLLSKHCSSTTIIVYYCSLRFYVLRGKRPYFLCVSCVGSHIQRSIKKYWCILTIVLTVKGLLLLLLLPTSYMPLLRHTCRWANQQ